MHLSRTAVGNNKFEIIQASLYAADRVSEQIQLASPQDQNKTHQKIMLSKKGFYKYKVQNTNMNQNQQRLLTKKLSIGDYNKLLQIIHDAIARHQQYPSQAGFLNETGDVSASFILQPSGAVSDVRVVRSSGFNSLDMAALSAIRQASPISSVEPYLNAPRAFTIKINFD